MTPGVRVEAVPQPQAAPAKTELSPAASCSQHLVTLLVQEAVAMLSYEVSVRGVLVPRCVLVCVGAQGYVNVCVEMSLKGSAPDNMRPLRQGGWSCVL